MKDGQISEPRPVSSVEREELVTYDQGPIAVGPMEIYLSYKAYEVVASHAAAGGAREVAGLLLGKVRKSQGRSELWVEQALRGQDNLSTGVSVGISYESWKYFIEEKAVNYPDLATVGWYHTHPGLGTFLSSPDEFIHQSFFDRPWQVALVVDPVDGQWTFFQHRMGGIERCERFLLVVPDRSHTTLKSVDIGKPRRSRLKSIRGPWTSVGSIARLKRFGKIPELKLEDCRRVLSWSNTPRYVAAGRDWVYWISSGKTLSFASLRDGAGSTERRSLPLFVDAIASSSSGEQLYLLSVDQAKVLTFRPMEDETLQSFPIELEDGGSGIEDRGYESDHSSNRIRMAWVDPQNLVLCTAEELLILSLDDEMGQYRVANRHRLRRRVYLGWGCLHPLSLYDRDSVILSSIAGNSLFSYNPWSGEDSIIPLENRPSGLISDLAIAGAKLVVLSAGSKWVLTKDYKGRAAKRFRLGALLKLQSLNLLGVGDDVYLVRSDGLWRCEALVQD